MKQVSSMMCMKVSTTFSSILFLLSQHSIERLDKGRKKNGSSDI